MSHSLLSFILPIPPGNNQGKAKQKILVSENSDIGFKMVILPQTNMEQNECIADLLFRSKLRLDNPGACAREYNSIMQIGALLDGTLN